MIVTKQLIQEMKGLRQKPDNLPAMINVFGFEFAYRAFIKFHIYYEAVIS